MLEILGKRERLTEQLPPTPCTPAMSQGIRGVAEELNISTAEVQRAAYSLFLSDDYSKTIVELSKAIAEKLISRRRNSRKAIAGSEEINKE